MRKTKIATVAVVAITMMGLTATEADASVRYVRYRNCAALQKVYPHGVGKGGARDHVRGNSKPATNFYRNNRLYLLNRGLDRDKDSIACEKPGGPRRAVLIQVTPREDLA